MLAGFGMLAVPGFLLESAMTRVLRRAGEGDRDFAEALHRSNMAGYFATRSILWDPMRFATNWGVFEKYVIVVDGATAGMLMLLAMDDALEIRDLQLLPAQRGRGTGRWAVEQAKALAVLRGFSGMRLRVFEENPARRLYSALGFREVRAIEGVMHMEWQCALPSGNP